MLAVGVAVGIYFSLQPYVGTEEIGWMCILGAAPFAACGFFTYHGMTAEQVLWAWFKSEILCPKRLIFKSDSYYYEAMQPAIRAGMKRMYNIDKPQERRKATGTGGIPPENIRLRRTLTTEYLQLSLCYGVRDRMSIETAGFTGWR